MSLLQAQSDSAVALVDYPSSQTVYPAAVSSSKSSQASTSAAAAADASAAAAAAAVGVTKGLAAAAAADGISSSPLHKPRSAGQHRPSRSQPAPLATTPSSSRQQGHSSRASGGLFSPASADAASSLLRGSPGSSAPSSFVPGGLPPAGAHQQPQDAAPKPRRRNKETAADHADGLEVLIQKTRAINMETEVDLSVLGEDEADWVNRLHSHNPEDRLYGIRKIRKYVCGGTWALGCIAARGLSWADLFRLSDPLLACACISTENSEVHAQNLITYKVLEKLMWLLQPTEPDLVLFETLWVLTNIAAGPTHQTTEIVNIGFLPLLVQLLRHESGSVRTQAAWAIGNIVGDREGFRDRVLKEGTLPAILTIWQGKFQDESSRKEAFRIAMWVVDNMCRYKPDWHQMAPAFETLPVVLKETDPYLLKECCWAIARILHQSGRHPAIDCMITQDMCSRLMEILHVNNMLTTHPILRALINLSSSKNPIHVQYIIEAGVLNEMYMLLSDAVSIPRSCRSSLQVFAMQILGNIASNSMFAHRVTTTAALPSCVIDVLCSHEHAELRAEACICIRNLVFHRIPEITNTLVELDVIPVLIAFLKATGIESKSRLTTVEAIGYTLEVGPLIAASKNAASSPFGSPPSTSLLSPAQKKALKSQYAHDDSDDLVVPLLVSGARTPSRLLTSLADDGDEVDKRADALKSPTSPGGGSGGGRTPRAGGILSPPGQKSRRHANMPYFAARSGSSTMSKKSRALSDASAQRVSNPYVKIVEAHNGFDVLVDSLVASSGQALDQMDEDGPGAFDDDDDDDSGSDSDSETKPVSTANINFSLSGSQTGSATFSASAQPTAASPTGRSSSGGMAGASATTSTLATKQAIVTRLHAILVRWFNTKFQERVHQAQLTSQVTDTMSSFDLGRAARFTIGMGASPSASSASSLRSPSSAPAGSQASLIDLMLNFGRFSADPAGGAGAAKPLALQTSASSDSSHLPPLRSPISASRNAPSTSGIFAVPQAAPSKKAGAPAGSKPSAKANVNGAGAATSATASSSLATASSSASEPASAKVTEERMRPPTRQIFGP
ncbi:hypothetical protein HK105_201489 [Polyrhizophydium stewartii]|uniref:Uncharacterized protein n=1 Tax=Polyrhizophydium stewartii TaxID=2732419 RepID=A0ABR4NGJ6_9FUNG